MTILLCIVSEKQMFKNSKQHRDLVNILRGARAAIYSGIAAQKCRIAPQNYRA